jgi:hypothetical protein
LSHKPFFGLPCMFLVYNFKCSLIASLNLWKCKM